MTVQSTTEEVEARVLAAVAALTAAVAAQQEAINSLRADLGTLSELVTR